MKISYSWLQQHIDISDSPQKIAELLTGSGLEVEGIEEYEKVKGGLKGLVIGEVLTCEKHPNADKLKITTVNIGQGEPVPIVCGAPNVDAGQKVVVATVGAELFPEGHDSFQIKKAKIRGEVSEGMICAEDEIGLGKSHDGIMVLNTDLPAGTPAAELFNIQSDYVIEIGLTPNRGDAASHFGVARDLKALLNKDLNKPVYSLPDKGASNPVEVTIESPTDCIRYAGVTISGITVKESPEWLRERLKAIGLSPINNLVDITNFILHDLGQPLHAFDLEKVSGNKIVVKKAKKGEEFVTLDDQKRKLNDFDLMICNEKEPMCIAGVFGGAESGVTEKTTSIFLESACFAPDTVRKTSMSHGLKTDSSFRFERGTDPDMPVYALKKAVNLILEVAGGEVSSDLTDVYPAPAEDFIVETSYQRITRLVGKEIAPEKIKEILQNLDIKILEENNGSLKLAVAPYRVDVQREADVIEEIIRIYGYDNIEIPDKISTDFLADFPLVDKEKLQTVISQTLAGSGFNEIITNSLTKPEYSKLLKSEDKAVNILNKLSEDLAVLRQDLIFSGLEVINYNVNRRQKDLKFFEFGKTYFKNEGGYSEYNKLALFMTGGEVAETWIQSNKPVEFYALKQAVHKILEKLNLTSLNSEPASSEIFKYGLTYKVKKEDLVSFGLVNNKFLKEAEVKQPVWFAEFDLEVLFRHYSADLVFQDISKFPEVRRDLSLVLDKKVTFGQIKELALQKERKLLQSINVFDVYEGKNIGEDKKSYSISFTLQDFEKTLNDKVIDKTMEKLMKAFEGELGAVIRK